MAASPQAIASKRLLVGLGPDVKRIRVINSYGQETWRTPTTVADADVVMTNAEGKPIVMLQEPGRPRKVEVEPNTEAIAEMLRLKKEEGGRSKIIKALKEDPDSLKGLDALILGMAEEQESIRFERTVAEKHGKDTSTLSIRRSQALRAIAETLLKKRELATAKEIDLSSPTFKVLLRFILETVQEAMRASGLPEDAINDVFTKFGKKMNATEWEADARRSMKTAN